MNRLHFLSQPARAIAQHLRARRVTLLLHQEGEMNLRVAVIRIEIERLAVVVAGFDLVSRRIAHEAQKIKGARGWTVPAQVRFATRGRFDEMSLIGQADGVVDGRVRLGRSHWKRLRSNSRGGSRARGRSRARGASTGQRSTAS